MGPVHSVGLPNLAKEMVCVVTTSDLGLQDPTVPTQTADGPATLGFRPKPLRRARALQGMNETKQCRSAGMQIGFVL